jgi:dihydroorotate dehydrogenase (NAD+) catalytic subunit
VQYLLAGASLVAVGTAALKDPRVPERLVRGLAKWCERQEIESLAEIVGSVRL